MRALLAFILIGFAFSAVAQTSEDVVGFHPGYVLDVDYERSSRSEDFNIFSSPPQAPPKDLSGIIFDDELTREFRFQYEIQFGRSDAERNLINPGRFDEYFYQTGVSVTLEEDRRRKRVFGEYMVKRLMEHHVDGYAKSRESLRTVYELKDRLSKVNVETKSGFKFRFRYSLSGNFFQVRMKNPYGVDARVFMQMDPQQFGPGEVIDTRVSASFTPARLYQFSSDFFLEREGGRMTLSRVVAPGVATSLTVSHFPEILERFQREESLAIVGISWTQ